MKYGLPYKGSKQALAERICNLFPRMKNFYDLFCGGCSITHCALTRKQFQRYVINDSCEIPVKGFMEAVSGKFSDETRWISHEEFNRVRFADVYATFCFSFGNDCRSYCYGQKIEPYKKACHYAIVFDEWEQMKALCPEVFDAAFNALQGLAGHKARRLAFGQAIVRKLKALGNWDLVQNNPLYKSCHWRGGKYGHALELENLERLQSLQSLQSLERLQSLQSLQSLERLQSLQRHVGDYRNIVIEQDSVVYCDIPYEGTETYHGQDKFDYPSFYSWCERQTEPVFISSYQMPQDRFREIAVFQHLCSLNSTRSFQVEEKVFVPVHQEYNYFLC